MFVSAIDLNFEMAVAVWKHAYWAGKTAAEPARSVGFTEWLVWAAAASAGRKDWLRSGRSKYDCSERLVDGEPYFVLRAQDMLAPELVEAWAVEAELNGCPKGKVADARAIAAAMRKWRKRKMPD